MHRLVPVLILLTACADVTSPEDGLDLGPVVQVKDWFTSAFLAPAGDGGVMFDAGFREGRMERALTDLGQPPGTITDVVLTHGHSDHVGALGLYPDATVWALPAERDLVLEESGREVDQDLAVGVQEIGGLTLEVFSVPGHTDGSAVILIDGVLLLGDTALQDRSGELVPVGENRSDDPEQAVMSLRELADVLSPRADEVRWLAPSHSAPIEGFQALADF